MFGYVFINTNCQNRGKILKIPWYHLNETCMVIHWPDCYGKGNLKKRYLNLDGRKFRSGIVCSFVGKQGVISVSICGRHRNGWKEAEYGSYVEEIDEKVWTLMIPHHFFTICIWDALSGTANQMKQSLNHKDVWITFFCWSNRKITGTAETSRTNCSVVLRYGGTCSKMCWAILWVSKQQSGATLQSFASLLGLSPFQEGRTRSWLGSVRSLLANCLEMRVLGTNLVDDLTSCGRWTSLQDQSQNGLRHAINDWQGWLPTFITRMTIVNIVIMENTAQHCRLGYIPRRRLCWRPWGLKVNLRRCLVYFWEEHFVPVSWMCKKQT